MAITYNAEEIYQMGVEIEKNGKAFYIAAAESTADEDAKKLFNDLSAWEDTHITFFEELKSKLPKDLQEDTDFDFDNQKQSYIKAAADSHVFLMNKDIAALARDCNDVVTALKMALQFEKDSVVLYTSMKAVVSERLGKSTIDKLIDEEIIHVAMLQQRIGVLSPQ